MLPRMIARLVGVVSEVHDESAILDLGHVAYEVLVPRYLLNDLASARGRSVTLHTLQYFEGNPASGNLVPRLVGFTSPNDIRFFERFTKVKGVGIRKALRALAEPVSRVAVAIENADAKALARLPGIGPRTADQIVAELRGKVGDFAVGRLAEEAHVEWSAPQRDAIDILQALGERRVDAEQWVARVAESDPSVQAADEIVKTAYRMRVGV